jgi:hypothetical protein
MVPLTLSTWNRHSWRWKVDFHVIPALRRLKDFMFEASLGYIARPCLKIKNKKSRLPDFQELFSNKMSWRMTVEERELTLTECRVSVRSSRKVL